MRKNKGFAKGLYKLPVDNLPIVSSLLSRQVTLRRNFASVIGFCGPSFQLWLILDRSLISFLESLIQVYFVLMGQEGRKAEHYNRKRRLYAFWAPFMHLDGDFFFFLRCPKNAPQDQFFSKENYSASVPYIVLYWVFLSHLYRTFWSLPSFYNGGNKAKGQWLKTTKVENREICFVSLEARTNLRPVYPAYY